MAVRDEDERWPLTEIEVACLEALAEHPLSIRGVAKSIGRDRDSARRALDRLRARGWVEECDATSGQARVHQLTDEGGRVHEAIEELRERFFEGRDPP